MMTFGCLAWTKASLRRMRLPSPSSPAAGDDSRFPAHFACTPLIPPEPTTLGPVNWIGLTIKLIKATFSDDNSHDLALSNLWAKRIMGAHFRPTNNRVFQPLTHRIG